MFIPPQPTDVPWWAVEGQGQGDQPPRGSLFVFHSTFLSVMQQDVDLDMTKEQDSHTVLGLRQKLLEMCVQHPSLCALVTPQTLERNDFKGLQGALLMRKWHTGCDNTGAASSGDCLVLYREGYEWFGDWNIDEYIFALSQDSGEQASSTDIADLRINQPLRASSKNLLLTWLNRLGDAKRLKIWLASFRKYNTAADVVLCIPLVMSEKEEAALVTLARSLKFSVHRYDNTLRAIKDRHGIWFQFLAANTVVFDRVITSDAFDIYFQRDPFAHCEFPREECGFSVGEEDGRFRYFDDNPVNERLCLGDAKTEALMPYFMVNNGFLFGTYTGILAILELLSSRLLGDHCLDQCVLNDVVRSGEFERVYPSCRVHVHGPDNTCVKVLGIAYNIFHDSPQEWAHSSLPFLVVGQKGNDSSVVAAVHMYDDHADHLEVATGLHLEQRGLSCEMDDSVINTVKTRREKPLVAVHFSHGGGGFVWELAKLNGEKTFKWMGSHRGDLPREQPLIRGCIEREQETRHCGVTFTQVERGFEDGEFCPDVFDYVLFLRDPMKRMNSHLSKYPPAAPIIRFLREHRGHSLQLPFDSEWNHMLSGEGVMNFDNILTRWLTADSYWLHAPIGSINETAFNIAVGNLQRFRLVIPISMSSNETLLQAIGWQPFSNISVHHHADHVLSLFELTELKVLNTWDIRLWSLINTGL